VSWCATRSRLSAAASTSRPLLPLAGHAGTRVVRLDDAGRDGAGDKAGGADVLRDLSDGALPPDCGCPEGRNASAVLRRPLHAGPRKRRASQRTHRCSGLAGAVGGPKAIERCTTSSAGSVAAGTSTPTCRPRVPSPPPRLSSVPRMLPRRSRVVRTSTRQPSPSSRNYDRQLSGQRFGVSRPET